LADLVRRRVAVIATGSPGCARRQGSGRNHPDAPPQVQGAARPDRAGRPSAIEFVIGRYPDRFGALVAAGWKTGCRQDELVGAEHPKLDHARLQLTVIG
jgi:hypothetical protein